MAGDAGGKRPSDPNTPPAWFGGGVVYWERAPVFDDAQRAAVTRLAAATAPADALPGRLEEFVVRCEAACRAVVEERQALPSETAAREYEVETACLSLLRALNRLSGVEAGRIDATAFMDFRAGRIRVPVPPKQWNNATASAWTWAHALHVALRHRRNTPEAPPPAEDATTVTRERPDSVFGAKLVEGVMRAYRDQFGAWPPYGQRSPFVKLTQELGALAGVKAGPVIVLRVASTLGAAEPSLK